MNQMLTNCLSKQLDRTTIGQNGGMELEDEEHRLF